MSGQLARAGQLLPRGFNRWTTVQIINWLADQYRSARITYEQYQAMYQTLQRMGNELSEVTAPIRATLREIYQRETNADSVTRAAPRARLDNFETPQTLTRSQPQDISPQDPTQRTLSRDEAFLNDGYGNGDDWFDDNDSQSNMQDIEQAPTQQSRSAPSNSSNRNISSGETPIIYATPTYHLPETHTVILPTTFYGCLILNDLYKATDLVLRMNDYRKPLVTLLQATPTTTDPVGAYLTFGSNGLYNCKLPQAALVSTNGGPNTAVTAGNHFNGGCTPNFLRFPKTEHPWPMKLAANQQPICKMASWWEEQFEYYSTLSCEYEIVLQNTNATYYQNTDAVVFQTVDTYTNLKLNNKTSLEQPYYDAIYWKNFKKIPLPSTRTESGGFQYHVIKGVHKPGMGRRMVENDGDEQRWTNVTSDLYTDGKMVEDLHLMFYPGPFNSLHGYKMRGPNAAGTTSEEEDAKTCFNFSITLKYIVQFKDLNKTLREFNQLNASSFVLDYDDMAQSINQTPHVPAP